MIEIVIPLPPPINSTNAGRKHTRALTEWKAHAGWIIKCARLTPIEGAYLFRMMVSRNACTVQIEPAEMIKGSDRADVDGRIKHAMDLFVTMGVTPDDRHCMKLTVEKVP